MVLPNLECISYSGGSFLIFRVLPILEDLFLLPARHTDGSVSILARAVMSLPASKHDVRAVPTGDRGRVLPAFGNAALTGSQPPKLAHMRPANPPVGTGILPTTTTNDKCSAHDEAHTCGAGPGNTHLALAVAPVVCTLYTHPCIDHFISDVFRKTHTKMKTRKPGRIRAARIGTPKSEIIISI